MDYLLLLQQQEESDNEFVILTVVAFEKNTRKMWIENHIKFKESRGEFRLFHDFLKKYFRM